MKSGVSEITRVAPLPFTTSVRGVQSIRFITFQYEIWDHSFRYTFFHHNFDIQHMKWRNWRSWLLPGRGRAHTQFDKGCSLSLCMVNNLEGWIQDFKWGGGGRQVFWIALIRGGKLRRKGALFDGGTKSQLPTPVSAIAQAKEPGLGN